MTATGEPETSRDQLYFRAIEDAFIALRGAPLLLSPADWQAAQEWHRQGIPLDLVRRVLVEVFEKRRERGTRGRINSLRYCTPAVTAAWEELRELQAPGEVSEEESASLGVGARLGALAGALPPELPERRVWAERILRLEGEATEVEASLVGLDEQLVAAVENGLTDEESRQLDTEVEESLTRLSRRLPDSEIPAVRRQLLRQSLRRRKGLPLLTLFGTPPRPGES